MSRASRADAAGHHQELIEAASRLFRERGAGSVSGPDVMAEIGLSRGGFYKHFDSKEALVASAIGAAFGQHIQRVEELAGGQAGDDGQTRAAFLPTAVGAVLMARATAGDPISDDIRTAARRRLG